MLITSEGKDITIVSHPWASSSACLQSHTNVCSFQQANKSAPRLRPLRPRNFKEQALTVCPDMLKLLRSYFCAALMCIFDLRFVYIENKFLSYLLINYFNCLRI